MSENLRRRWRRKAASHWLTDALWRIAVGVIGGTVVFVGILALIGPGPGWLLLFIGFGILASEFAWAERALNKAKAQAVRAKEKAVTVGTTRVIIVGTLVVGALLAAGAWLWVL